jgi:hypothetical protein
MSRMSRRRRDDDEFLFGDDLLGDEPEEPAEAVEGSGQAAARLADGSGFLIVNGPGAGSVTGRNTGQDMREAAPLPGRDDALDGTLPLFIVHRPHIFCKAVPRLLAQLHAAAGSNLALGVSSWLPGATAQSHAEFSSSCSAAAVRIIDPLGFVADPQDVRVKEPSDRAVKWAPYLRGGVVSAAGLLDMQRERGANLLLTSGATLAQSDARRSLAVACDEGDDALAALKPGERLALNLTVSADWLRRPQLLDALLTELIEQQQFDIWHVRVQWPSSARAWAQPTDEKLLAGYRKLAATADDEERRLLLPQTGLTGWLMLAWGAAGFGTGPFGSTQGFLEPVRGGGGKPKIERYFERQLLHHVERTARPLLTGDPGYTQCTCPYCRPLLAGAVWSHEYAGLHYLFSAGILTAQVAPAVAGRRGTYGAVGRAVRGAVRFADGKALTGNSYPAHLRTWDQLL